MNTEADGPSGTPEAPGRYFNYRDILRFWRYVESRDRFVEGGLLNLFTRNWYAAKPRVPKPPPRRYPFTKTESPTKIDVFLPSNNDATLQMNNDVNWQRTNDVNWQRTNDTVVQGNYDHVSPQNYKHVAFLKKGDVILPRKNVPLLKNNDIEQHKRNFVGLHKKNDDVLRGRDDSRLHTTIGLTTLENDARGLHRSGNDVVMHDDGFFGDVGLYEGDVRIRLQSGAAALAGFQKPHDVILHAQTDVVLHRKNDVTMHDQFETNMDRDFFDPVDAPPPTQSESYMPPSSEEMKNITAHWTERWRCLWLLLALSFLSYVFVSATVVYLHRQRQMSLLHEQQPQPPPPPPTTPPPPAPEEETRSYHCGWECFKYLWSD